MVFADVVGQPQVTETLKRQVAQDKLSHAYLFTGTRGTGKTTCAKILAAAANCLHPEEGEPCNKCQNCVGIADGSITDVIEIDAASNSGVENIRSIRDQTVYAPAEAKMRVYIIDECHMLSQGAFNALLKTLEEPPGHVLFILATTELHKVPATILSRCQRYNFRRIEPGDIAGRLTRIAGDEDVALDAGAAELIASLADGGMRDALSIFDQCCAVAADGVTPQVVRELMGLAGAGVVREVALCALADNTRGALDAFARAYADGVDVSVFLSEIGSALRDMLVYDITKDKTLTSPGFDTEGQGPVKRARLLQMLSEIQDASALMQRSRNRRLDAELCIMRLCDQTLSTSISGIVSRLERLETGAMAIKPSNTNNIPNTSARETEAEDSPPWDEEPSPPPVKPAAATHQAKIETAEQDETEPQESSSDAEPPTTPMASPSTQGKPASDDELWQELMPKIRGAISMSHYSHLAMQPTPVFEQERVVVLVSSPFALTMLGGQEIKDAISKMVSEKLGRPMRADIMLESGYVSAKPAGGKSAGGENPAEDKFSKLVELGEQFSDIIIE